MDKTERYKPISSEITIDQIKKLEDKVDNYDDGVKINSLSNVLVNNVKLLSQ